VRKLGDTPGDLGLACTQDTDCNGGGFCLMNSHLCSRKCSATAACPTSFDCNTTPDFNQVCEKAQDSGGCSAAPSARRGVGLAATLLAALAVALTRRRRRS
jgi:uncharacterized protein (TIGR03382 family)